MAPLILFALVFLAARGLAKANPVPAPTPDQPNRHFAEVAKPFAGRRVHPGDTYLFQLMLPAGLSLLVNEQRLRGLLEEDGWQVLLLTQIRPENWPSQDPADWYAKVHWPFDSAQHSIPADADRLITRAWQVVE